jgi:hypothetical protein
MIRQFRQGDVLLCAVDEIPVTATSVLSGGERVIVALGELTGHAHAFAAQEARLFVDEPNGRSFVAVPKGGAALVHEEHDPIHIPPGAYEVKRQREYTPARPRYIAD